MNEGSRKIHWDGNQHGPRDQGMNYGSTYITSLKVRNIRCFGPEQTLDLTDSYGRPAQWTVILGENGTGKTTLLQCIAVLELEPLSLVSSRFFTLSGSPFHFEFRAKVGSEAEESVIIARFREGVYLSSDEGGIEEDERYVKLYVNKLLGCEFREFGGSHQFSCYGYGACRQVGEGTGKGERIDFLSGSLFFEIPALLSPENWLIDLDYADMVSAKDRLQSASRVDHVRRVLIDILPDIEDIRLAVHGSEVRPAPSVEFLTPYGWVCFDELSLGYRTVAGWIVDLMARLLRRYPDSPNPLAEPCVVLVDEFDLHMHPRWQPELIGYLMKKFPNAQFIVTTHGPLVVQAASNANIALLRREGNHVVIDKDRCHI